MLPMCLKDGIYMLPMCLKDGIYMLPMCLEDGIYMLPMCLKDGIYMLPMCLKDGIYMLPMCLKDGIYMFPMCLSRCFLCMSFMYFAIVPIFFFLGLPGFVVKFIFLFNYFFSIYGLSMVSCVYLMLVWIVCSFL